MSSDRNNRLAVLASEITSSVAAMRHSAEAMAERALEIGRALIEAKATIPHGQWAAWLGGHVQMSARTARRYMQLVKRGVETATVADLGIRGALEGPPALEAVGNDAEIAARLLVDNLAEADLGRVIQLLEPLGEHGLLDFQLALLARRWREASEVARTAFLAGIESVEGHDSPAA